VKKSIQLLLIFFVTLITSASLSRASDPDSQRVSCRCTFNGTKDYQLFDESKSYFGRRTVHRKWTCEYSCETGSVVEKVIGNYQMTNHGDDNGLEGICEGTVYESEFNQAVMREVYMYKSTDSFNPKKAKAAELKQWAESHGCESGSWLD
jgi:hypothetical protein